MFASKVEVSTCCLVLSFAPVAYLIASSFSSKKKKMAEQNLHKKKIFDVERKIDIDDGTFPSDSELHAMESCMSNCRHGWFTSCYKDAQLHYRKFLPTGDIKGVLIFFHGIVAHSGTW